MGGLKLTGGQSLQRCSNITTRLYNQSASHPVAQSNTHKVLDVLFRIQHCQEGNYVIPNRQLALLKQDDELLKKQEANIETCVLRIQVNTRKNE